MNDLVSHAVAFLLGTGTGAAGKYFADKYTDQRRKQEAVSASRKDFRDLIAVMPDLLIEMQRDINQPQYSTYREFFVIPKDSQFWDTRNSFFYVDDGANNYFGKAHILENRGYVIDVTAGNTPQYRMTEKFITSVRAATIKA